MERAADCEFITSDERLLDLCKQQDQEALRVLFRRHERGVYNLLYRMLSSQEDAEEALAEVFVKVWRSAAGFKGDAKFTTWLFRIAANTARDVLRSRMSRQEVSVEDVLIDEVEAGIRCGKDTGSPEQAAIVAEDKARIRAAMNYLSEEDRLLISLHYFQEFDYEEIAQIASVPLSNLKVKLFRARGRLRKLCADQEKDGNENELRSNTA